MKKSRNIYDVSAVDEKADCMCSERKWLDNDVEACGAKVVVFL